MAVTLFLASLVAGFAAVALVNGSAAASLRANAGEALYEMAHLMALSVSGTIESQVTLVKMRAASGVSQALVESPGPGVVEAAVIDLSGKVSSSSSKSPYLYTGDHRWLGDVAAGSKEDAFIGESMLYEPSNVWVLPIAAVIRDGSGAAKGAYRAFVDISSLCGSLGSFVFGSGADASLVDEKGYLVYRKGAAPYSGKFSGYDDMRKVATAKDGYAVIDGVYRHRGMVIAASSPVGGAELVKSGIDWSVFAVQDEREVLGALWRLRVAMASIALVVAALMIPAGILLGAVLLRPAKKIKVAIEHLTNGEFDFKTGVFTGDEMEAIGRMLDDTADAMKKRVTTLSTLDKEKAAHSAAEQKRLQMEYAASKLRKWSPVDEKAPEVIDQALDIAAVEDGRLQLSLQPVEVKDILRKALLGFEPRAREKGLDIRSDVPRESIMVKVDAVRMGKAFNALMQDAVSNTERGSVRLSAQTDKTEVVLIIADTRIASYPIIGKKPQAITDDMTLAVFTARDVIEAHGGRLLAESEQGKGNRYIVRLPKQ